jgi:urease accessory protein
LRNWLEDVALWGSGRNDAVLLRAAHQSAPAEIVFVDATARAFAASAERLHETLLQGTAFCTTTQTIWGGDTPDLTYPVAVGCAARRAGIDVDLTCAMFCQAFLGNLVSAAVRAVPLGQTEGQEVLAALTPLCQTIAEDTAGSTLDDLASCAFLSDIAAMRHETLQPRIFRS